MKDTYLLAFGFKTPIGQIPLTAHATLIGLPDQLASEALSADGGSFKGQADVTKNADGSVKVEIFGNVPFFGKEDATFTLHLAAGVEKTVIDGAISLDGGDIEGTLIVTKLAA